MLKTKMYLTPALIEQQPKHDELGIVARCCCILAATYILKTVKNTFDDYLHNSDGRLYALLTNIEIGFVRFIAETLRNVVFFFYTILSRW